MWEKIQEKIEEEVVKNGVQGSLAKTFFTKSILEKLGLDKCKFAITAAAPMSHYTKQYFESILMHLYQQTKQSPM